MLFHLFSLLLCSFLLLTNQTSSVVISPCKVNNLLTQPIYGTSLKTKTLVNIIQIPPVFTQNVMVGICENRNKNITTGRGGEFYVCQQRYSAVEVYITEGTTSPDAYRQPTADKLSNLKYIRESVIIESGCDFTFNLFPFVHENSEQPQGNTAHNMQQRMFLRSPYHPTANAVRQPTASSYLYGQPQPDASSPHSVTYTKARTSDGSEDENIEDDPNPVANDEEEEQLE